MSKSLKYILFNYFNQYKNLLITISKQKKSWEQKKREEKNLKKILCQFHTQRMRETVNGQRFLFN